MANKDGPSTKKLYKSFLTSSYKESHVCEKTHFHWQHIEQNRSKRVTYTLIPIKIYGFYIEFLRNKIYS